MKTVFSKTELVPLEVKPSSIHGSGVFAKTFIKKDTPIGIFTGKFYHREEIPSLLEDGYLFLPVSEDLYLGPENPYDIPALFSINHSCEPNAGIDGDLTIVALRDIQPDEEITIDYATVYLPWESFLCNCNTPGCRHSIHRTDIFSPTLQKKYGNFIGSWIKRKFNITPEGLANKLYFEETGAWGLVTALDLHDCDPHLIRDREAIYRFTIELCDLIKVKRFGEPIIVHFGEDERVAGYSLVQLIETSLVSGHFANLTNSVYLDIFSCAYYNPAEVISFSSTYFKARSYNSKIYLRH